jgi:hypothetical protein
MLKDVPHFEELDFASTNEDTIQPDNATSLLSLANLNELQLADRHYKDISTTTTVFDDTGHNSPHTPATTVCADTGHNVPDFALQDPKVYAPLAQFPPLVAGRSAFNHDAYEASFIPIPVRVVTQPQPAPPAPKSRPRVRILSPLRRPPLSQRRRDPRKGFSVSKTEYIIPVSER